MVMLSRIRRFRTLFSGRTDVYGTYDPRTGRSWQVKGAVTDEVIRDHLLGRQPYGVYLLVRDRIQAAVVDFDQDDFLWPRELVLRAEGYGLSGYTERSKSKGYHVWFFFGPEAVPAFKARMAIGYLLSEIGSSAVEVFPKQDRLAEGSVNAGNFINAPLFGALVPHGRTVFIHVNTLRPYPNQWDLLDRVIRIPESTLDEMIEVNGLQRPPETHVGSRTVLGTFRGSGGLPPCMRRMLERGVDEYQRVSCFRLAVHLRRLGLPFDVTVAALAQWRTKNHPVHGKRILTLEEVQAQTAAAYLKEYWGNGCEEAAQTAYCVPECPLFRKRNFSPF